MSKILKTISNDISRSFLIGFIALLIAIPCGIFLLVMLYENNQSRIDDWVLIAAFILWEAVFLGGMVIFITSVSRRRKKWLDAVFTPLGLTGKRYLINWWEYRGKVNGQDVLIRFYKGPTLEISVQTPLNTRFGITSSDQPGLFMANLLEKTPMLTTAPELQNVTVFALDEAWVTTLLSSNEVAAAISRLMLAGESWALIKQVLLVPGYLRLTLYRNKNLFDYRFDTAEVQQCIADLAAITHAAQSVPPPTITAEESRLEMASRSYKATRIGILILVGFFLLIGICVGLTLWLLVKFAG